MIITTPRSRARAFIDAVLTALGWALFFALFVAGILDILAGAARGPDAPFLPQALTASMSTLAGYLAVMGVLALGLMAWFIYNEYVGKYSRYGRYRRLGVAAVSAERLRQSLAVTPDQFGSAQAARVLVVQQDEDGTITGVKAVQ